MLKVTHFSGNTVQMTLPSDTYLPMIFTNILHIYSRSIKNCLSLTVGKELNPSARCGTRFCRLDVPLLREASPCLHRSLHIKLHPLVAVLGRQSKHSSPWLYERTQSFSHTETPRTDKSFRNLIKSDCIYHFLIDL